MQQLGFNSIRLPINIPTANNPPSLAEMKDLITKVGGGAVICMFGTGNLTTHGTGRIDSMPDAVNAWSKVHAVFGAMENLYYEIFNEPHGYSLGCNSPPCGTPQTYYSDMKHLIAAASLPEERCILDALGWAEDVPGLLKLGWEGNIGYHFYPWWLPGKVSPSRADFNALLQASVAGVSERIFITEFGGGLNEANLNYEQPSKTSSNVNCLQGMDDAVSALQSRGVGIKGAFHWHGWKNGDSFSFFEPANKNGSTKVLKILEDCCSE